MVNSLIPVVIMGIAYLTTPPTHSYNWEIQYDQFYYAANAREMFEKGNGLAYPNPFDCSEDSPVIYSHLFPLLVGYLWRLTDLPIMFVYIPIRIVFGVLLTVVVWHLASFLYRNVRVASLAFCCLMISGGGISTGLGLMALVTGKIDITQFFYNLDYIEGVAGWWFLNIFRNFFYATEILYHFIFFLSLLLLLQNRWKWSVLVLTLMLYAHPYTGLQLGLVSVCYFFLSFFLEKVEKKRWFLYGLLSLVLVLIFICYNIIWLRSFSQHRELMNELMKAEYAVLGFRKLLICWGIWLVVGSYTAVRYGSSLLGSREWRLIVILLMVSFILVNHHYLSPYRVQPAHFSHGYVFTPLVMLTFYFYEKLICQERRLTGFFRNPFLIGSFIIITALDNVCFLPRTYATAKLPPATITNDEKEVLHFLSTQQQRHVVATTHMSIGYLVTVFTHHDALIGYLHHTPQSDLKRRQLITLIEKGDTTLLNQYKNLDIFVLSPEERDSLARFSFFKEWEKLFQNHTFYVYKL